MNICLNPHTVYKNQPADSLVGQVMIDDSSSSLLTCSKQHCCPKNGRHFNYNCNITNPEDNEALPRHQKNVSALFQLDGQFRLRTRVPMNSNIFADNNDSLAIQISCVDTKHPLHYIGQSLVVKYAGMKGLTSKRTVVICQRSRLVTYGCRSFNGAGPKLWNNLPLQIIKSSSIQSRKN